MAKYSEFMIFAHDLADTSSRATLGFLKSAENVAFETKSDKSPVTALDQRIEEKLRGMIAKKFPEHGILGEEFASEKPDAEFVWVIDPIDGTKAFITGMPVYGTLISLAHNGIPILGIIDHPLTNDRWSGMDGAQSTHNGIPVHTRTCRDIAEAIVSIGNPESLSQSESAAFNQLRSLAKWGIYGGNCYVYGRLSMGRVDISLDSGLAPFDFCALSAVVNGAGGRMTDWEGLPLTIHSGRRVAACGDPELHSKVLDILRNS